VHWREREHEELDVLVEEDPGAIAMLKQCGMWKFFQCPFMRAQPRLLNHLVEYWHPDAEAFMLEGQSLTPTTEDIYFLTDLSRRGEPVNLRTFPPGSYNIEDYIGMYCEAGTEKVGSQVSIHKITSLHLRIVLFMIGWITGSTTLHQASRAQMHCAVQCLEATIFYWSTTMLTCMKKQLTDCRRRMNKNFGFGHSIMCFLLLRECLVLARGRQYGGILPPFRHCAGGQFCCLDRVEEEPRRLLMTNFLIGGPVRFLS
jgi:hypothetical protein